MPGDWRSEPEPFQRMILDDWEWQLAQPGCLSREAIMGMRTRLLYDAMFSDTAQRTRLLVMIGDILADERGCDPADIPGSPLVVPDDPSGLSEGRRDWLS